MKNGKTRSVVLHSLAEIPVFASEDEEAVFWDTHDFSNELLASFTRTDDDALPATRPRVLPSLNSTRDSTHAVTEATPKKAANKGRIARRAKRQASRSTTVHQQIIDAQKFGSADGSGPTANLDKPAE